jgi:N-acetylglutamate synthase-like GNAT family acetyltransferase
MKIHYLNWDTEFFGIKTGKIEIIDENDFNLLEFNDQALLENYELIYLFKYGKMLSRDKMSKSSIELVDIILTMSKQFNNKAYVDIHYEFRNELSFAELKDCYNIAEQTSAVSRFCSERKVGPEKTKELYRKWIDNALNQSIADGLFLVKKANSVVGIHLIKTDIKNKVGFCSLIGVASNYKGLGIGENLWEQSFGFWANESNIERCKVSFSFQNYESFNFHLKMGFNKIEETKYIYHFINKIY